MLVDLSVGINEETPVYPGDPATKIAPAGLLNEHGYQDHYLSIGTHVGTHMDAPSHMLANGKNLNEFPVEKFTGRGVYIRVQGEFETQSVEEAGIERGDIVLFHTGASDQYHDASYFTDYPLMSEDIAKLLIEKGASIVGVDTCSVDKEPTFPIHKMLLGKEVLIIENLTNLGALSGKSFRVHAYPMNLEIDGAPVRAVAELLS